MRRSRSYGSDVWRERAIAQIAKHSTLEPKTDCWLWLGARTDCNYGVANIDKGTYAAHRVAFYAFQGLTPDGRELDHLCENTLCVNPAHLEPVTKSENLKRRWATRKTLHREFCARGHKMEGDNVALMSSGYRRCRACEDIRNKAKYEKRKRQSLGPVAEYFPDAVEQILRGGK